MIKNKKSYYKLAIIFFFLLLGITGCAPRGKFVLDGYSDCEEYFGEGFREYTDYCKYYYTEKEDTLFKNSADYTQVTIDEQVQKLITYFEKHRYAMSQNEDQYDFNASAVNTGDYYCLIDESKDGLSMGKYSNYTLYYYDVETHTLYYIHCNF